MKREKFHYHVCSCGKWKCANKKCNLSSHAKCGFRIGNDFTTCRKNKATPHTFTFDSLAAKRVSKEIGQSRFLCDAVRLNLNAPQAKLQLREYRKAQRALAKKAEKKQIIVKPENLIEVPALVKDTFISCV